MVPEINLPSLYTMQAFDDSYNYFEGGAAFPLNYPQPEVFAQSQSLTYTQDQVLPYTFNNNPGQPGLQTNVSSQVPHAGQTVDSGIQGKNPPSGEDGESTATASFEWGYNANNVIQELVDSDRIAQEYHAHLELRLREEHANLEQERQRSAQLELQVSDLQWSRNQMEQVVARAVADAGELRKQLGDLRRKSDSAECRIISLSSLSDSLLKILFHFATPRAAPQDQSVHSSWLDTELCRQQDIIRGLEQSNRQHADLIQSLRNDLDATEWVGSHCGSGYCGAGVDLFGSSSPETVVGGGEDEFQENGQPTWSIMG
ncbi:uncharacterized protein BDV17DRAFT_292225 [Aspergillus undulatus]|uniref:uncharacterized protein n=1 Tax=Aspergillus undulatus TaxID=1810928 RepID=UPI003CCCDD2A